MTELETMQRAKMYVDKLANGIDPLTDQPVSDTDCINQVRISRCLFYVSDVLRQVIENGGTITKAVYVKKLPCEISQESLQNYRISQMPITVSEITKRLNALIDVTAMNQLQSVSINTFLQQSGLLTQIQTSDGKTRKCPTDAGKSIGIVYQERTGQFGDYHVTVFNAEAQQFVLDHMDAILEINNRPRSKRWVAAEPQQDQPFVSAQYHSGQTR